MLLRIGVKGPGTEEMWCFWHIFKNEWRVEEIKGCCVHSIGICLEGVHGNCLIGTFENSVSICVQALVWEWTFQSIILDSWFFFCVEKFYLH